MEKIRDRHAGENSGKEARDSRGKDKSKAKRGGTPRSHAIRARNQRADAALDSMASRFLLNFTGAGALNITDERRPQDPGYSVLGNEPAEFVSGNAKERKIERPKSSRQRLAFNGETGQHCDRGHIKRQHPGELGQQLLFAFFLLHRFLAIALD